MPVGRPCPASICQSPRHLPPDMYVPALLSVPTELTPPARLALRRPSQEPPRASKAGYAPSRAVMPPLALGGDFWRPHGGPLCDLTAEAAGSAPVGPDPAPVGTTSCHEGREGLVGNGNPLDTGYTRDNSPERNTPRPVPVRGRNSVALTAHAR